MCIYYKLPASQKMRNVLFTELQDEGTFIAMLTTNFAPTGLLETCNSVQAG